MNKQTINQIRELKETKTLKEIAELLKLPVSTISYWSSEEVRKNTIKRSKDYFKNLSPEKRKAILKKSNAYRNDWIKKKYKTEEKFRESWKKRRRDYYAKNKVKKQ